MPWKHPLSKLHDDFTKREKLISEFAASQNALIQLVDHDRMCHDAAMRAAGYVWVDDPSHSIGEDIKKQAADLCGVTVADIERARAIKESDPAYERMKQGEISLDDVAPVKPSQPVISQSVETREQVFKRWNGTITELCAKAKVDRADFNKWRKHQRHRDGSSVDKAIRRTIGFPHSK